MTLYADPIEPPPAAIVPTPLAWMRDATRRMHSDLVRSHSRDYVTEDDVRTLLAIAVEIGSLEPQRTINFISAVFKCADWQTTGREVKGRYDSDTVKCWKYVGITTEEPQP